MNDRAHLKTYKIEVIFIKILTISDHKVQDSNMANEFAVYMTVIIFIQNLTDWIEDKGEVEIVDLIIRIKDKLVSVAGSLRILPRFNNI